MQLSMTVLRCPDQVAPEARTVPGGEFHVGRGPGVDWVLPDPDRLLSKQHFAVAFRGGAWQVADTSTNGTYLNGEGDSIGRGATRSLRDGDRLRLGAYEIEIRLVGEAIQGQSMQSASGGRAFSAGASSGGHSGQSPFGDPFADDPLAPSPEARRPFDEPAYPDIGMGHSSAQLPHDFDPLAPDGDDAPFGGGFRGPVQSDHSSSMDDAMAPPAITGYSAPQAGGIIPGDDLLPDDWDKDLLEGIAPPQPSPQGLAPQGLAPQGLAPQGLAPQALSPQEPPPFGDPDLTQPPIPAWQAAPPTAAPIPESIESLDFLDPLAPDAASWPAAEPEPVQPAPEAFVSPAAAAAAPAGTAPIVRQHAPRPATPMPLPDVAADPGLFIEPEAPPAPIAATTPFFAEPAEAASPFDEPPDPLPLASAPAQSAGQPPSPAGQSPAGQSPAGQSPAGQSPAGQSPAGRSPAGQSLAGQSPASQSPTSQSPTSQSPAGQSPAGQFKVAAPEGEALAAFFNGAELTGATPADPTAMMTGLGQAFRAMVAGLRAVLIARATIKGEFRIEQTMIRARGNNPLKFSANDDDALTALLGIGRRTDMTPAAAIEDSLRDLRMHELATMAAMQVAVRAMLDELSPDKIRATTDQGGLGVLPGQRKARAWDAFEARHNTVVRALVDDFDSIFGKSFARAYERALDEITTRERQ